MSDSTGSLGSRTRELWRELVPLLPARPFGIWPFDGGFDALAKQHEIVLAEIYPRACYGLAFATDLLATPIAIAKTKAAVRAVWINRFVEHPWLKTLRVGPDELTAARKCDDDFDALLSGAAVLRCVESGTAMEGHETWDRSIEGSILGVNLLNGMGG